MVRGKPDFWLLLIVFLLLGFGLIMVFSSSYYQGLTNYNDSYYFFKRQLIWAAIGIILFFLAANTPYSFYQRHIGKILLGTLLLLLLVLIPGIGVSVNGAQRWIQLAFFSLQPSEPAKLVALIYTASIMTKKQEYIGQFKQGILPPLIVITLLCRLIVVQPHYSTTILLAFSCIVIIYYAGTPMKHLFLVGMAVVPVLVGVLFLKAYRIPRILTMFDPWKNPTSDGYQIIQSLYAIGPGGLSGGGLGNSIQKLAYLPEAHTDFIFSIIAEELGFLGGLFLILLFIAFIFRGLRITLRAPDSFGTLLGIGIISLLSIQTLFNLGVATAVLPVTGVPLPFISYGGASLLTCMLASGILLNISRYSTKKSRNLRPSTSPLNSLQK